MSTTAYLCPSPFALRTKSSEEKINSARSVRCKPAGEASILERVGRGEAAAVNECLDLYGGLVWSLARRLSPTAQDAEDAVQEIFIDIWKNAEKFNGKLSAEKTFIAMLARRRLIDRWRRSERRPRFEPLEFDSAGDQHEAIEREAEASLVKKLLEILRPEQRQVLEMSIDRGMTHSEISSALTIPLGTVKSHLWRGLALVREQLRKADKGRGR